MMPPNFEDIPGLITLEEGQRLYEVSVEASNIEGNDFRTWHVEIGSNKGKSARYIAAGTKNRLLCVDTWPQFQWPGNPSLINNEPFDWNGAFESFRANTAALKNQVLALRMPASEAAKAWVQPIAFWFHDADHGAKSVASEFLAWEEKVIDGGWFLMHDFYGRSQDAEGNWYYDGSSHQSVLDGVWFPTGEWRNVGTVESLWFGQRISRHKKN